MGVSGPHASRRDRHKQSWPQTKSRPRPGPQPIHLPNRLSKATKIGAVLRLTARSRRHQIKYESGEKNSGRAFHAHSHGVDRLPLRRSTVAVHAQTPGKTRPPPKLGLGTSLAGTTLRGDQQSRISGLWWTTRRQCRAFSVRLYEFSGLQSAAPRQTPKTRGGCSQSFFSWGFPTCASKPSTCRRNRCRNPGA